MLSRTQKSSKQRSRTPHPFFSTFILALLLFTAACGDSSQPTPTPGQTGDTGDDIVPTQVTSTPRTSGSFNFQGVLDDTFGEGGKVTTDLGSSTETIRAIIVQSDGKIAVAGEARPIKNQQPKFTVARYNADGSLDTTFADEGIAATNVLGEAYDYSQSYALLAQPDGKLVAVGTAWWPAYRHSVFAAVRYNTDGSLDELFGDGGKALIPVNRERSNSGDDTAYAASIQPDGKIVLAGTTGIYPLDFAIARINTDGSLDETFGDAGVIITDVSNDDGANAVAIQDDGKIVVAGFASSSPESTDFRDFAVVRYNSDGSLDTDFGEGGKLLTDIGGDSPDVAYAIALVPGGKIVLAGTVTVGAQFCSTDACWKNGFGLVQYNSEGSLDTSFGDGGMVSNDYGFSSGNYSLVRLPDGRLATAGYLSQTDFGLEIYNADGSLDTSLGKKGIIRELFGEYQDEAHAVALQPDGKVVLAGTANVDPDDILNNDFAIIRYK